MNIKANVNFHNKFIIEVRDKDTNELKKTGMAENIILDRAYTRVCNFSSYFSYIHFGTGSGVTVPTRTTLFTPLGYKSTIDDKKTKGFPISSVTRRIRLEPEEYVGSTITEVGISETTNAINTHALIRDAEGNPLNITKTALDVVIIYATVFVELQNPSNSFQFINFPDNGIVKYFLDNSTPSAAIACDFAPELSNSSSPVLATNTGAVTVDVANRKRKYKTRFGVDQGNGAVRGNRLVDSLKVSYPASNIFTGHNFAGVTIGAGDGAKRDFNIPHIHPENIVLKVNDVATTSYELVSEPSFDYRLQLLAGAGSNAKAAAINGDIIATASYDSPYFTVHKFNPISGLYEKIQNLAGVGVEGMGVAIDGDIIVAASGKSPYSTVHKFNPVSGLYEKIQDLTEVGASPKGVAIDGDIIVTFSFIDPYFTVHKLNPVSGLYEKIQDLAGVGVEGRAVSIDGDTIVASTKGSPYFTVHKFNPVSGLYEKIQNLAGVGVEGMGVVIDGDTIVASTKGSPYFTVHKFNPISGLYGKIQDLTVVGTEGTGETVDINGDIIVAASGKSPYFAVHKLNPVSGLYEKIQNLYYTPTSFIIGAVFNGDIIVTFSVTDPYFTVHKMVNSKKAVIFDTPPEAGATITADYSVDYIPKSTDYVLDVEFELTFGEGV